MNRFLSALLAILLCSPAAAGSLTLLGVGGPSAVVSSPMPSIYSFNSALPSSGTAPEYFGLGAGGSSASVNNFNVTATTRQSVIAQAGKLTGLTASYIGTLSSQVDVDILLNGAAGPNFTCHLAATTNPTCTDVYSSTGHSLTIAAPSGTSGTNTATLSYVTGTVFFDTSGTWAGGQIQISAVFQPTSGNAQSLVFAMSTGSFNGTTTQYGSFQMAGVYNSANETNISYMFAEPGTLSFLSAVGSQNYGAANSNLISICHNTTAGSPGCITAPTAGVTTCSSVSGLLCVQTNAGLVGSTNYPVWDSTDTLTIAAGDTISLAFACQTAACATAEFFGVGALFTPSGSPIGQNVSVQTNNAAVNGSDYGEASGYAGFATVATAAYSLVPDLSGISPSATTLSISNVYVAMANSPGATAGSNFRQNYLYASSTGFGTPAQQFQVGGASFHIDNTTQLPAGFCATFGSTCAYGAYDTTDTYAMSAGYLFQYFSTCTACSTAGVYKVASVLTVGGGAPPPPLSALPLGMP